MANSDMVRACLERLFPDHNKPDSAQEAELAERFVRFAREVATRDDIDGHTRFMAILATLLGCQGTGAFRVLLPAALEAGVTPVEAREIVYQALPYLGIGRVQPFFAILDEVFTAQGIELPLPPQGTTGMEDRREKGTQAQVTIFGEGMRNFWQSGPEETRHINLWLAANCFGDYYTRTGLDLAQREMITFCLLAAQGGCEPQLVAHAKGNMQVGNDRLFLIGIVSQCLPYIGYPRSLNALRCVEEAAAALAKN